LELKLHVVLGADSEAGVVGVLEADVLVVPVAGVPIITVKDVLLEPDVSLAIIDISYCSCEIN